MKRVGSDEAWKRLQSATSVVRQYAGSDASKAIATMLVELERCYMLDLIDVKADDLPRVQAALKQVASLADVINGEGIDVPKVS